MVVSHGEDGRTVRVVHKREDSHREDRDSYF